MKVGFSGAQVQPKPYKPLTGKELNSIASDVKEGKPIQQETVKAVNQDARFKSKLLQAMYATSMIKVPGAINSGAKLVSDSVKSLEAKVKPEPSAEKPAQDEKAEVKADNKPEAKPAEVKKQDVAPAKPEVKEEAQGASKK